MGGANGDAAHDDDDGIGIVADVHERVAGSDVRPEWLGQCDRGDVYRSSSPSHMPFLRSWQDNVATSFYDADDVDVDTSVINTTVDPCSSRTMNNVRQRGILTAVLQHLRACCTSSADAQPTQLRALVCGVAGTGKTFVMKLVHTFALGCCHRFVGGEGGGVARLSRATIYAFVLTCGLPDPRFTQLAFNSPDASYTFAPTGAAAGACAGTTVDRALSFSRSSRTYKPLAKDVKKCGLLIEKYTHVHAVLIDEISMWGQLLYGHASQRMDEVFNGGVAVNRADLHPARGDLDIDLNFGDHKQLSPVLDTALFAAPKSNACAHVGARAYAAIDRYFVLTQPVRQDAAGDLIGPLTRVRNGEVAREDVTFWKRRQRAFQAVPWDLWGNDTLIACCFSKDRADINERYVATLTSVCVIGAHAHRLLRRMAAHAHRLLRRMATAILDTTRASCAGSQRAGKHASLPGNAKEGMMKALPVHSYMAMGMMVKLTINICPELGLYNGSRGIVRCDTHASPCCCRAVRRDHGRR